MGIICIIGIGLERDNYYINMVLILRKDENNMYFDIVTFLCSIRI
jgi:hypothetical protein